MERATHRNVHRVFVYGTLKRGHGNSRLLAEQKFLGETKSVADFKMFSCGWYPCIVKADKGREITGELWEVNDICLRRLDALEGVPHLYTREKITLQDGNEAMAYLFASSTHGLQEIETGFWEKREVR